MNLRNNLYEWIDSYLNGEMSEGERLELENRLKTDEEFAKTFEAQKISHQIIIGQELMNLKAQMAKDLSGNNPGGMKKPIWKYLGFGAAILTAVIIYLFLNFPEEKTSPEKDTEQTSDSISPVQEDVDLPLVPKAKEQQEKEDLSVAPSEVKKENTTCADSLMSFSCQARAACLDQENGAIEVDVNTIKSGKAPYVFSVNPEGPFVSGSVIPNLKPGKYNLFVKDADECIRKLNVKVEVPEVRCDPKK